MIMSDLQAYYDNFATQPSRWADPDPKVCACRGGWFYSEVDTYHKCPYHFKSYLPHPDDEVSWEEHAVRCMVGFFGRCKEATPPVPSGSCYPHDENDDIPF